MRAIFIATVIAASGALAACTTTPQDEQAPAGVEDRTGGSMGGPGGRAKAVEEKPIASVDLTQSRAAQDPMGALKDPGSPLSRRTIYYDFDKFDIADQYRGMVEAHARYLRENPGARMLIQGNADERGSREYNVGLGQRRSDGVKKMLILLGAREDQIESVSLGEEKPEIDAHNEEAWAKNRRSDILYGGKY